MWSSAITTDVNVQTQTDKEKDRKTVQPTVLAEIVLKRYEMYYRFIALKNFFPTF